MAKSNIIKLMSWNANSIKNKLNELIYYIKINQLDVIGINETKLDSQYSMKIPGYIVYRSDRTANGGGVAMIIRKDIKHHVKPLTLENIESVSVCIQTKVGEICVISAYLPPGKELSQKDLREITKCHNKYVLMGDLNARHKSWNCISSNKKGKDLLEYCLNKNITIAAPNGVTHYPKRGLPSVIDLFLIKNIENHGKPESVCELSSDHNPITLNLFQKIDEKEGTIKYNLNKTEWSKFASTLDAQIDLNFEIKNEQELDKQLNRFLNIIKLAVEKSTPRIKKQQSQYEIPPNIKSLIKKKNACRKRYYKTRDRAYKLMLVSLTQSVKRKLSEWRNKQWQFKLENAKAGDTSLWQLLKNRKTLKSQIPPIYQQNEYVFKDKDKLNLIAEHFERVHNSNNEMGSINHQKKIVKSVTKYFHENKIDKKEVKLTSPKEIHSIIKSFSSNKAPGADEVTYLTMKKLTRKGLIFLTKIANSTMLLGYYPKEWKAAKVLAIPKPNKNPSLPESYRPISLLSHISKVIEKIIERRLATEINKSNQLMNEQFGFRSKHNTEMQLARVINNVTENYNCNKHTGAIFLDIEKAFDCVWHYGLLHKLINLELPKYIIHILKSYLSGRTMYIEYNGVASKTINVTAGVPQGSVLGPKLYNIYINDMPRAKHVNLGLFADDTVLYTNSYRVDTITTRLENTVTKINRYFMKWKIRMNKSKTEAILFTKRYPEIKRNLKIEDCEVE